MTGSAATMVAMLCQQKGALATNARMRPVACDCESGNNGQVSHQWVAETLEAHSDGGQSQEASVRSWAWRLELANKKEL